MSRHLLASVLAAALVASSAGCIVVSLDKTRGSGNVITENRDVEAFDEIVIRGSADCDVEIGEPRSLSVEADDNIVPLVTTEVRGGRLIVASRGSYSTSRGVLVRVVVPSLRSVTVAGSGSVDVIGLDGGDLDVSVLGSGDVVAVGRVERLDVSVKGSGDVDVSALLARDAAASIAGSGDIDLHATESLVAKIAGSGDITYRGNPERVDETVMGSGSVTAR